MPSVLAADRRRRLAAFCFRLRGGRPQDVDRVAPSPDSDGLAQPSTPSPCSSLSNVTEFWECGIKSLTEESFLHVVNLKVEGVPSRMRLGIALKYLDSQENISRPTREEEPKMR